MSSSPQTRAGENILREWIKTEKTMSFLDFLAIGIDSFTTFDASYVTQFWLWFNL